MLNLDPTLLLVLTACLYILVFGGLSLLRREGLSVQFAVESIVLSAVLIGAAWLLGVRLSPIVLLIALYLVTLRSRLIVDVANLLVRRKRAAAGFKLYDVAAALRPDASSRLVVRANRGAAELLTGQVDTAIGTLEGVLADEERGRLGMRYEAACRYNLGYAYELKGEDARSTACYNQAIDTLPGSMYARAAEAALRRRKRGDAGKQ